VQKTPYEINEDVVAGLTERNGRTASRM